MTTKAPAKKAAVKKAPAKKPTTKAPKKVVSPKPSLATFCKASKAWIDWETVTLGASGGLNSQWLADTLAYIRPVYQSAPKEIHYAALQVASNLMISRREIVALAEGTVDLPNGFDSLLDSAAVLSGQVTSFAANRDAFAAYMLSKCKVDMTASFKALSGE